MSRLRIAAVGCAVMSLAVIAVGCGGPRTDPGDEGLFDTGGSAVVAELKPVDDSKGVVTITGVVTLDGDVPAVGQMPGISGHTDANVCLAGKDFETKEQTWMVDPNTKAVANVVVWVTPPKGHYFKKPADDRKTWPDEVKVDQPHCAFIPHVVVLYPQASDGKGGFTPTGQKFTVLNSAPVAHNIRLTGRANGSKGGTLGPGGRSEFPELRLEPKRELSMNCDIHKWMNGFALTFDHPYAAVTGPDGKFEIKNVPAGADLTIQAWHESRQTPTPEGGASLKLEGGKPVEVKFTIKK